MKNCLIISALGKDSFLPGQVKRIREAANTKFIARLDPLPHAQFVNLAAGFEFVALTRRCIKHLDRETLEQLTDLEGLAIYSTGYEWVDHYYLNSKGILISYLKNYSTVTVAEHNLGLMLSMSRRIHLSSDRVRGLVPASVSLCGWELSGKRLGIVGLGRIGKKVAELATAFGMHVCYHDTKRLPGVQLAALSLEDLLACSDVISLCASRKYGEPPILLSDKIQMIKPGAYIINAGRPELVETDALFHSINMGKVSGYAVDEKLERHRLPDLKDFGRVLETGHTAWYSREAIARGMAEWTDNICALAQETPINLLSLEE